MTGVAGLAAGGSDAGPAMLGVVAAFVVVGSGTVVVVSEDTLLGIAETRAMRPAASTSVTSFTTTGARSTRSSHRPNLRPVSRA